MSKQESEQHVEAGAEYVDCCCRGLGAGAGNTQTEVLCAALQRMGYNTGVNLYDIQDVAEDLQRNSDSSERHSRRTRKKRHGRRTGRHDCKGGKNGNRI